MTRKTPRTAPLPTTYYGDVVFVELPTVGKKLAEGKVELMTRLTRQAEEVSVAGAPAAVARALSSEHDN